MTTAATDVLAELRQRGITVTADGEYLRLRPSTALTPELRERARAVKPELLALLAPALDAGLAVHEVLGFPAVLIAALPLATSLVLGPRRRVVSTRSLEWTALIAGASLSPRATVHAVLQVHNLDLIAVAIDGGKP
jgi:hypothetical protein